jgi:hypothetical protein
MSHKEYHSYPSNNHIIHYRRGSLSLSLSLLLQSMPHVLGNTNTQQGLTGFCFTPTISSPPLNATQHTTTMLRSLLRVASVVRPSSVARRTFSSHANAIPTTGLCFELTDEQKEFQDVARKFTAAYDATHDSHQTLHHMHVIDFGAWIGLHQ